MSNSECKEFTNRRLFPDTICAVDKKGLTGPCSVCVTFFFKLKNFYKICRWQVYLKIQHIVISGWNWSQKSANRHTLYSFFSDILKKISPILSNKKILYDNNCTRLLREKIYRKNRHVANSNNSLQNFSYSCFIHRCIFWMRNAYLFHGISFFEFLLSLLLHILHESSFKI